MPKSIALKTAGAGASRGLAALGIAIAALALAGSIAGPYTLVIPAGGDPARAAAAACDARAAILAVVLTKTLSDGSIEVFYGCEDQ